MSRLISSLVDFPIEIDLCAAIAFSSVLDKSFSNNARIWSFVRLLATSTAVASAIQPLEENPHGLPVELPQARAIAIDPQFRGHHTHLCRPAPPRPGRSPPEHSAELSVTRPDAWLPPSHPEWPGDARHMVGSARNHAHPPLAIRCLFLAPLAVVLLDPPAGGRLVAPTVCK